MNHSLLGAAAFLLGSSLASAEGVRIVHPSGALDFADIQEAVDAASDGDVLLVAEGIYSSFTIDDKALSVLAAPSAEVVVDGTIEVRNLSALRAVVLGGLSSTGAGMKPRSEPGLRLIANLGDVRAQACSFTGGQGVFDGFDDCHDPGDGGHGVDAQASLRVAMVGCVIRGGRGGSEDELGFYECEGGDGGAGVSASSAVCALYDCEVQGGLGGQNGTFGGDGGIGYHALGFGFFASGSSITGGGGGEAWDFLAAYPGDGGDGAVVTGGPASVLDSALEGGPPGNSLIPPAVPPQAGQSSSGAIQVLAGDARRVQALAVASDAELLAVHVSGQPGDRAYLVRATEPAFALAPALAGVWLARRQQLVQSVALGVLPASGELDVLVKTPELAPGVGVERQFLQGLVFDSSGFPFLASPLHLAVLDRGAAPDCDGNGSLDYLDVLEGTAADCDGNLVPDACQIASGASPDCNANGVPDSCDVSEGSSADVNMNGVPDECEGANTTWHVDASAPAGGDGSLANPFQAIGDGMSIALPGDRVLVEDGLYSGSENRDLDFAGRDLEVVSANGPANCVIDCQGLGRGFLIVSGETLAARVEGFTVRNASASEGAGFYVWQSDATLVNCVIEDCSASSSGGGMYLFGSDARVRGCLFQRNEVTHANNGGGALAVIWGAAQVDHCEMRENSSSNTGGAMYYTPADGDGPHLVSHCVFDANTAGSFGGAVYTSGIDGDPLVFGNCLFSGNSAPTGGAFAGLGALFLLDCTLVDNNASDVGGAIQRHFGGSCFLSNGVVWGNTAPAGPSAAIQGNGGSLTVGFTDFEGGMGSVLQEPSTSLVWQNGNIELDPLFADPAGPDGDPLTTADNDYRLAAGSPCIDAGDDPRIAPDLFDFDGDGNTQEAVPFDLTDLTRQTDDPAVPDTGNGVAPIVDLGAYERQP